MTFIMYLLTALLATGLVNTATINLNPTKGGNPSQRFHYFDIDLLKSVAQIDHSKNVMVSPASVKATLAMLLEGARGPGADEIREILRLPSDQNFARAQLHQFLLSLQTKSPGVTLEGANRIFLADYLALNPEYSNVIRQHYLSDVTKVNFSRPQEAANTVNAWVNQVTHGFIPSLVEPSNFDSSTMLLLANALYFKGNWEYAFDTESTFVRCFYGVQQTCTEAYMMEITKNFKYADVHELNAQALEIPYQDGRFSMIILLPNEQNGIQGLVRDLPYKSLDSIIRQMREEEVQVTLPRFKIDYTTDLVPALQELGIRTVFGAGANLSGIVNSNYNVLVNNVFHKTHIEVNEQGSIAAAVTGAMVIPLMGSTSERFRVNHPFLFFIRDLQTGTILFEGKVVEPILAHNNQPQVQPYFQTQQPINIPQPQAPVVYPSTYTPQQQVQTQQPQYVVQNGGYAQQQNSYPQQTQQQNNGYAQTTQQQSSYPQQVQQQNSYSPQTMSENEKQSIHFINQEREQSSVPIIQPVRKAVKVTPPLTRFSQPSIQNDGVQQNYASVPVPAQVSYARQAETQYSSQQVYAGPSFQVQRQILAYQQPLPTYSDGITFERERIM